MLNIFLPVKGKSERISNKNFEILEGVGKSLLQIKVDELLASDDNFKVVVSTLDCREIVLEQLWSHSSDSRLSVVNRPEDLKKDISTDRLSEYVGSLFSSRQLVCWTHVTSPFITRNTLSNACDVLLGGDYDSVVAVKRMQTFCVFDDKPVNFGGSEGSYWPMTQNLEPVFEITSGFFIASAKWFANKRRFGVKPYWYELDELQAIDIDWPEQFESSKHLLRSFVK